MPYFNIRNMFVQFIIRIYSVQYSLHNSWVNVEKNVVPFTSLIISSLVIFYMASLIIRLPKFYLELE